MMEAMNPQCKLGTAKASYIYNLCSMIVNVQILYLRDKFFKLDEKILESNAIWQG